LALARGVGGVGGAAGNRETVGAPSVCWTSPVFVVDRATLSLGQFIADDHTIVLRGAPEDVDEAELRERITTDPEDAGIVYAWDGREIGRVLRNRKGSVLLRFRWPDDLPASRPDQ